MDWWALGGKAGRGGQESGFCVVAGMARAQSSVKGQNQALCLKSGTEDRGSFCSHTCTHTSTHLCTHTCTFRLGKEAKKSATVSYLDLWLKKLGYL